jgi:thiol:disulfide interchange protein DsbC
MFVFKRFSFAVLFSMALFLTLPDGAGAFGGCDSNCANCHKLTKEEASEIIKSFDPAATVENVQPAPSKGLWELTVKAERGRAIAYLDYSKENLILGNIVKIKTKTNMTAEKLNDLDKIDVSTVPLENSLYIGSAKAKYKFILFTDPDCPYCRNFHKEINETLKKRNDLGFYVILFPLRMHPDSYRKSKSIICEKSIKLLDEAVEGKSVPDPKCDTKEVDENIKLGEKLGISGTPTAIMPNGRIMRGALSMENLLKELEKK